MEADLAESWPSTHQLFQNPPQFHHSKTKFYHPFCQPPAKTGSHHPPEKITAEASLFEPGFGFFGGM